MMRYNKSLVTIIQINNYLCITLAKNFVDLLNSYVKNLCLELCAPFYETLALDFLTLKVKMLATIIQANCNTSQL